MLWRKAPAGQASPHGGHSPLQSALARQVRTRQGVSCWETKSAEQRGSYPRGDQYPGKGKLAISLPAADIGPLVLPKPNPEGLSRPSLLRFTSDKGAVGFMSGKGTILPIYSLCSFAPYCLDPGVCHLGPPPPPLLRLLSPNKPLSPTPRNTPPLGDSAPFLSELHPSLKSTDVPVAGVPFPGVGGGDALKIMPFCLAHFQQAPWREK